MASTCGMSANTWSDLRAQFPASLNSFASLGLSAPILEAIGKLGFETPTEIQEQAIPRLIEGDRDFIGLAQTGTGKTAAFGLPLLEHLDADQSPCPGLDPRAQPASWASRLQSRSPCLQGA